MTSSCTDADLDNSLPATNVWPDLSLLGVILIWGINLPVMKIGLEHMNIYAFNAFRLTLSAIVLVVIAVRRTKINLRNFSRSQKWQIFRYAVLASGLYQVLFLLGIAQTTSANAALIFTSVPMWTALMGRFLIYEKLTQQAWTGLSVAFVGTVVVTTANGVSGEVQYLVGNIIILLGALAWSYGTVVSRPVMQTISPLTLSAIASVSMLPVHYLLAWNVLGEGVAALSGFKAWSTLLYSGVFSTGFALAMWNYGVRHTGAAHASVYQNLLPLVAMISAFLIRGETVTPIQIIGGILIIGGLVLMRRGRNTK